MGRVNGGNSDYIFKGGAISPQVEMAGGVPIPAAGVAAVPELYLKIYICPHGKPSALETETAAEQCKGLKATCPQAGAKKGHALVHLHQETGLELVTDNSRIHLNQAGKIALEATQIELGKGAAKLTVNFSGNDVLLANPTGGAAIILKADGSIEIRPAAGKLLTVAGEIKATKFTPAA